MLKSLKVFAGTGEPQKAEMKLDIDGQIKSASKQEMDLLMLFLNVVELIST